MRSTAWIIKAPLFYLSIRSQVDERKVASAPIVAYVFHQPIALVGVLLAVLGYALGTYTQVIWVYIAWFCGQVLQFISQ